MRILTFLLLFLAFTSQAQKSEWVAYQDALKSDRKDTIFQLGLAHLNLTKIPDSVFLFKNLKALDLSSNQLTKISKKLKRLKHLNLLKIERNGDKIKSAKMDTIKAQIRLVNKQMEERDSLAMILSKKREEANEQKVVMITSPDSLLIQLKQLWKDEFEEKNRLAESWNKQVKFPRLKNIKSLFFSYNRIETLPKSLKNLRKLTEIQLHDNQITAFPIVLTKCKKLQKINLANNQIESVTPKLAKLKKLHNIILYKNKLTAIPSAIYQMKNLVELDLAYNEIKSISPLIGNLQKLELLYLSYNQMIELPDEMGYLTNLKDFFIHHNRLLYIPNTIEHLKNLKTLHINNNQIIAFPKSILALKNMEDLNISHNSITDLSLDLQKLYKLQVLLVSENMDKTSEKYSYFAKMLEELRNKGVVVHE